MTPVGVEQRVEAVDGVAAAAVGRGGTGRARSRWWSSWCPSRRSRPGAPAPRLLAVARLRTRCARPQGSPWRPCCVADAAARRHPARLEDRPHAGWRRGPSGCWRASGPAAAVKVLVTGRARACSAARSPGAGRPRRRRHGAAAPPVGAAGPRGARRPRRPATRPLDAALAGHDAVVHLAAKVDMVGPWREYARTNVDGTRRLLAAARAAGRGPARARLVAVGGARGRALVGAAPGPADPAGPAATTPAARPLAELAGARGRRAPDGPAIVAIRPHLVWGPGRHPARRPHRRAGPGRAAGRRRHRCGADRHHLRRQRRRRARRRPRPVRRTLHGQALVVSNGEPRPVAELLAVDLRAAGARGPAARRAGSARPRGGSGRRGPLAPAQATRR